MRKLIDKLFYWLGYISLKKVRITDLSNIERSIYQLNELKIEKLIHKSEWLNSFTGEDFVIEMTKRNMKHEMMESIFNKYCEWRYIEHPELHGIELELVLWVATKKEK